jgi:hypothetical protein
MKHHPLRAGSIGLILALGGLFSAGTARSEQEAVRLQQRPIEHQVAVTRKLIQVYVTDRKGNPVTDLGRDDFTVSTTASRRR